MITEESSAGRRPSIETLLNQSYEAKKIRLDAINDELAEIAEGRGSLNDADKATLLRFEKRDLEDQLVEIRAIYRGERRKAGAR